MDKYTILIKRIAKKLAGDDKSVLEDILFNHSEENWRDEIIKYISSQMNAEEFIEHKETMLEISNDVINDDDKYYTVLTEIKNAVAEDMDKAIVLRLDKACYWTYYAISVKKCLGHSKHNETLEYNRYKRKLKEEINSDQMSAHTKCLNGFNMDCERFKQHDIEEIDYFLHNLHQSKKNRIKKKNIKRVRDRADKLSKLIRMMGNNCMFANGKHKVPTQFADTIISIYLG